MGDTLTLTLRDVPSTFGYFHPYPIRGPLLFSPPEGFDAADLFSSTLTADTRDRWVSPGPVETAADEYEIVGLYEACCSLRTSWRKVPRSPSRGSDQSASPPSGTG